MGEESQEQEQQPGRELEPSEGGVSPDDVDKRSFEIKLTLNAVSIRPDMVERVTFTLDPGSTASWEYWDFQIQDSSGRTIQTWRRTAAPNEMVTMRSWSTTYTEFSLSIRPALAAQSYTFRMQATTKFRAKSDWASVAITMPKAMNSIHAEFLPDWPGLNVAWSDFGFLQPPPGTAVSTMWRYNTSMPPETVPGNKSIEKLPLPAQTNASSEYLFAMRKKYEYTLGSTRVTSYCDWTPDGGLKLIVAEWDPIPDATESSVYNILLSVSGHDPIQVTTEPNVTTYRSTGSAEPGVQYSIQIGVQDMYTDPEKYEYVVIRYGPYSDAVPAGTGEILPRTFVYDSAGRLGRATTGTRTTTYTYDVRDNLTEVDPS